MVLAGATLFLPSSSGANAEASARRSHRETTLVCLFLRGGLDGLGAVIPHADPEYFRVRPKIATPRGAALRLDDRFALHPRLEPLLGLYRKRQLAIVHAVGSHHPTRSHFEARDYLETGVPGEATLDGWVNRFAARSEGSEHPLQIIAMTPSLPHALRGREPALAIADVAKFGLASIKPGGKPFDVYSELYAGNTDPVSTAARRALDMASEVSEKAGGHYDDDKAVQYPRVAKPLRGVARLLKSGFPIRIAWIDLGGWDTHQGQSGSSSPFGERLGELAQMLQAFHEDLGERMKDVMVLTLTEFGRTVQQNGIGGTDHGHASAMFLLGGSVRGGRVYGQWPGLATSQLYEGRDLEVTTDVRQVLTEVAKHHLSFPVSDLATLFPGFAYDGGLGLLRG